MHQNSKKDIPNKGVFLEQQTTMFTAPLEFQKRRCTDICCVYMGVFFFLLCVGFSFGLRNKENVIKITYPSDSDGKVCGFDYPGFPIIYFTNLPEINQRVCVARCPKVQDKELDCMPTSTITCTFNQMVRFTDSQLQQNEDGNICMPVDRKILKTFLHSSQLQSRISFSNATILLTCQITFAISFVLIILINYFPKGTLETVQYLALIFELLLGIIVYVSKTQHKIARKVTLLLLAAAFLITMSQVLLFRHELKLNRVFIVQSSKFMQKNMGLTLYILAFEIILYCFIQFLLTLYDNLLSSGHLSFVPEASLYYIPEPINSLSLLFLIIFGVWIISTIHETYKFVISAHTVNWYLQIPNNFAAVKYTFVLLFNKHIGSILGSGFVNGFLLLPQMVVDLLPQCNHNDQRTSDCFFKTLNLVRSDTLTFVALAGLPFCNSSRYCEYFWSQTMMSDKHESSIRVYKIAGHMLVATIGSIIAIFIKEELDPYMLFFTMILGLLISSFFIDFNAISAQALQLLYIMEQEFSKRPQGKAKIIMNLLNRADQAHFLSNASQLLKNEEVAHQIRDIKKFQWKLENHQKKIEKRQDQMEQKLEEPKNELIKEHITSEDQK